MVKLQNWFHKYNAWSYTKHRLWGECKREYYFSYIGTALDWPTDVDVTKLKNLKKLDGRFVVQGKIIHEVIEKYIREFQKNGIIDEISAQEEFINQIESYRKTAKINIAEYFNGAQVNQTFFDKARENGVDQLSLFWGLIWPQIVNYQYLKHEEFDNFFLDGVKAIVKIDYVCRTSTGQILIYDWKTGSDNEEYENDLQISAYALWAQQAYRVPADQIQCNLVYLTSGVIKPFQFTDDQLENLKLLIKSDFREMNHDYEQNSFAPSPSGKHCISCQFATVCPSAIFDF